MFFLSEVDGKINASFDDAKSEVADQCFEPLVYAAMFGRCSLGRLRYKRGRPSANTGKNVGLVLEMIINERLRYMKGCSNRIHAGSLVTKLKEQLAGCIKDAFALEISYLVPKLIPSLHFTRLVAFRKYIDRETGCCFGTKIHAGKPV